MYTYSKIAMWLLIWFVLWIMLSPFRKGRENCLTYAIKQWEEKGGYIVMRWGRSNRVSWLVWPHFAWLPEQHGRLIQHVVPKNKKYKTQLIPSPWFEPKIIIGDEEEAHVEN